MGLILHLAALFAVVWLSTSLLVGALTRSLDAQLASLEPHARARLLLAALVAPLAAGIVVVMGIAFPHQWLGLVDHCLDHPGHLHLCVVHGAPIPHVIVFLLASLATLWTCLRLGTALNHAWRGARALGRVVEAARVEGELRILPGHTPMAFTVGLVSPFVVVSEAVASEPERWTAVLAHERSHVQRRDPLARWVAEALTAFHVPAVGAGLVARLRDAQELAADEAAAGALGCRIRVAETLVEWMRWRHASGDAGVGFHSGPFSLRVRRLLDAETYRRGPSSFELLLFSIALASTLCLAALPLHHAVETVFGALHS